MELTLEQKRAIALARARRRKKLREAAPKQVSIPGLGEVSTDNMLVKGLIGAGRGFQDVLEGVQQLYFDVFDPERAKEFTQERDAERELYANTPVGRSTAGGVGRFVGSTAPFMAIPGAGPTASLAKKVGLGIATGGAQAGLGYVPEGGSRGGNIAMGAGIGAAFPLAAAGIGKGINAVRGVGSKPQYTEIQRLARQYDTPISVGMATQKPSVQAVEKHLTNIPLVGTSGWQRRTRDRALKAAKGVVKRGFDTLDEIRDLDGVERMELDEQIREGLVRRLARMREGAKRLYDKVNALADDAGDFELTNARKTAQSIQRKILAIPEDMRSASDDAVLRKLGTLTADEPFVTNYTVARRIRSTLGDEVQQYYKGRNTAIGGKGVEHLQALRKAVERDMREFAEAKGGALATAQRNADGFYKQFVTPYRYKNVARAIGMSEEPDKVYRMMVTKSAGPYRARHFYQNLDPTGKQAVRAKMLAEAVEQATVFKEGGEELFYPAKFVQYMKNIKPVRDEFFTGSHRRELDGFINLMDHLRQVGSVGENPPTGNRIVNLIMGSIGFGVGFATAPTTTATIGGISGAISGVLTFPPTRRLILAASRLAPGSDSMQKVLNRLERELQVMAISKQQQPENPYGNGN